MKFGLSWLFILTLLVAMALGLFQVAPIAGCLVSAIFLVNLIATFARIKLQYKFGSILRLLFAITLGGTMLIFGLANLFNPMRPIGFVSHAIGSAAWIFAGAIFGLLIYPLVIGCYFVLAPFLDTYAEWRDEQAAKPQLRKQTEFFDD